MTGPLAGIKVIEVGQALAGPMAGMIMADMGAEVIKVEKPDGGDDARLWGPPFIDGDALAAKILHLRPMPFLRFLMHYMHLVDELVAAFALH